jgi:hypothetical protein
MYCLLGKLACQFLFALHSLAVTESPEMAILAADSECSVGASECALNALQLQSHAASAAANLLEGHQARNMDSSCTGTADIPAGLPLCYNVELLGETLAVKVLSYHAGAGKVSFASAGPMNFGSCMGAEFKKIDQQVSIKDVSDCNFLDYDYSIFYCSDQDQIKLSLTSPMKIELKLSRGACIEKLFEIPPALMAFPSVLQQQAAVKRKKQVISVRDGCSGDGNLPDDLPLCYGASLFGEVLAIKVKTYQDGAGTVSMGSKGPMQLGGCEKAAFTKKGQQVSIEDVSGCHFLNFDYGIRYCSNQDKVELSVTSPMTITLELSRTACSDPMFSSEA